MVMALHCRINHSKIDLYQNIKRNKKSFLRDDSDAEIILFSSRARGDFNDESNWDVLILVDKEKTNFNFKRKIWNALFELELKYDGVVTGIVQNKFLWRNKLDVSLLYFEVQKDGVAL